MKIISWAVLCVATAAVAADPPATNAPVATAVLARVNGTAIKRQDVDVMVRGIRQNLARHGRSLSDDDVRRLEWDVLDEMVVRELVLQASTNALPADLDQRVEQQLAEIQTRLGGVQMLTQALAETGITLDQYRHRVRENLIVDTAIRELLRREIRVAPEEARAFYEANKAKFHVPETVRASHILLRVPADAPEPVKAEKKLQMNVIRARLESGESFADVARQVSEDPGSAARGGDLGYFARGRMVPEFDEAAFTLKTNQLSEVVTTQFGYHLLLVTDHKPAREVPFEEAQEEIGRVLTAQKQPEVIRQYTDGLRARAKVEVLLPKPPPPPKPATP
jgi:peptidyl-prolyl cis-trans isomerase C